MRNLIFSIFSAQSVFGRTEILNFNIETTDKFCDYDPGYICGENEACGAWSCTGNEEDSTCSLTCADGSNGGSRKCSCYKTNGRQKIFVGCEWRETSSNTFCKPAKIEAESDIFTYHDDNKKKEKVFDDFLSQITIKKNEMDKTSSDRVFDGIFSKCEALLPGMV